MRSMVTNIAILFVLVQTSNQTELKFVFMILTNWD